MNILKPAKSPHSFSPPVSEKLKLTPEFLFVAACSWVPGEIHAMRQKQVVATLANSSLDWDEVASLVMRHGVVGQFCTVMGQRGWHNVPPKTKELLKSHRTRQVVSALSQVAELKKIANLFAEAEISLIPLKGVALSQELYGDHCIRSAGDLDILVHPEDVEKAEELLSKAGYRHALGFNEMGERQKCHILKTLHHHEYINDIRCVHIELHWRSYLWTDEQVASLWESSRSSTWLDASLSHLTRDANILFLADHGARHDWLCLKWLSDLAMLMQDLSADDWLSLLKKAGFFDLQKVVGQTAMLLEWIYGIEPPEKFRELFYSDAVVRKLSLHAATRMTLSAVEISQQFKVLAGIMQSLRIKQMKPATPISTLISNLVIIPADFVEIPLPDTFFWLYLPLRPFLWFKRHCRKK